MTTKPQIFFLAHGGGPLPLLGDKGHVEMVESLQKITTTIRKPSAILLISAHWEEEVPTITSGENPSLIYDYFGFPEESYHITYPSLGEPLLASQVHKSLESAGITSKLDEHRGFDHGLFVPLKIMYPDADIPCVQLSLVKSLDPATHLQIGNALQNLEYENLLVIGSGFSFHNLRGIFSPETPESKEMNEAFESWLLETCGAPNLSEEERTQRLTHWEKAPGARFCHPREEHLLPLHVCSGLANSPATESFELYILDRKASMYLWT